MRKMKAWLLALALVSSLGFAAKSATASEVETARIEKQVSHELNMLPYVNVFDYMAFNVDANGTVTLTGEVTDPVLKSQAANLVKRIEGVEQVNNQIQVLPVSFMDDGLRIRLFRTIYGYPALQKYGVGLNKSIRIIVANGRVTLVGIVDNQTDKNIAGIRANGVPGVFAVNNQLQVARS